MKEKWVFSFGYSCVLPRILRYSVYHNTEVIQYILLMLYWKKISILQNVIKKYRENCYTYKLYIFLFYCIPYRYDQMLSSLLIYYGCHFCFVFISLLSGKCAEYILGPFEIWFICTYFISKFLFFYFNFNFFGTLF